MEGKYEVEKSHNILEKYFKNTPFEYKNREKSKNYDSAVDKSLRVYNIDNSKETFDGVNVENIAIIDFDKSTNVSS